MIRIVTLLEAFVLELKKMLKEKQEHDHQNIRQIASESVEASLRIKALDGREVTTKSRKVMLTNLLPERLQFRTTLRLPPEADWTVSLSFSIESVPLEAIGRVGCVTNDDEWWQYEVELANPVTRALLTRLLNYRLKTRSPFLYSIHERYRRHNPL